MARNHKDFTGDKNPNYKTGFAPSKSPRMGIYNSWCNMKQRCLNPNTHKFPRYGGRGIKICDEWLTIQGFVKWAFENGWKPGLTLDRINNDGNYEPGNCKWVTLSENSKKKRTTKLSFQDVEIIKERLKKGENYGVIANDFGVVAGTIWFIKKGRTHR